jgi:hypothetical protein
VRSFFFGFIYWSFAILIFFKILVCNMSWLPNTFLKIYMYCTCISDLGQWCTLYMQYNLIPRKSYNRVKQFFIHIQITCIIHQMYPPPTKKDRKKDEVQLLIYVFVWDIDLFILSFNNVCIHVANIYTYKLRLFANKLRYACTRVFCIHIWFFNTCEMLSVKYKWTLSD